MALTAEQKKAVNELNHINKKMERLLAKRDLLIQSIESTLKSEEEIKYLRKKLL